MKKRYGLLGRDISYSLSPGMHNRAFRHFGIDAEYLLFDADEAGVDGFISEKVLSGELAGFNITVPYKVTIKEKLEKSGIGLSVDKWADVSRAVNTVKTDGRTAELWNTDMPGFLSSLNNDLGYRARAGLRFGPCFITGAGGAGRAIALLLAGTPGSQGVYVRDIDGQKLSSLREDMKSNFGEDGALKFHAVGPDDDLESVMSGCDLLVNASPAGAGENDIMPVPEECLRKGLDVYDLVYARETELVKKARDKGARAVNGLGMLIRQGAMAFNKWTGMDTDETARVMEDEIKNRCDTL